jgi:hypothetical protein
MPWRWLTVISVNLQRDLFDGMDNAVGTLKKTLAFEVHIGRQYIQLQSQSAGQGISADFQDLRNFFWAVQVYDLSNARFCPGALGAFVDHQHRIALGRNIQVRFLNGSRKIKLVDGL